MKSFAMAAAMAAVLCGCSGGAASHGTDAAMLKKAYNQGRTDASELIDQCTTTAEQRTRLLDLNARRTAMEDRFGKAVAQEYSAGMRSMLEERGDTLAATLF